MSQKADRAKHVVKTPPKNPSREVGAMDSTLIIRLVIAVVVFAVALIVKMPAFFRIVLCILAALAAGYDVILDAINSVEEGNYFATSLIVVFVAAIGFVIGFGAESAAMVILYQICALAIAYADKRTRASALSLVRDQDEELVSRVRELMQNKDATKMALEKTLGDSAGLILRIAMIIAVLYAILVPLFTAFPFRVSIHRALMIILVSTPASIIAAMPLTALVALCSSARKGVAFQNAAAMEKAGPVNAIVFDKAGVFSEDCPEVLAVQSDVLDRDTFMNFAAHAVYNSEQPLAQAISAVYDQEYKLDVISDFKELPGSGVELKIGGTPVLLATDEYLISRGASLPQTSGAEGQVFHMIIAGRYIGKIIISANVNGDTGALLSEVKDLSIKRCVLLTEDGDAARAEELGFSEVASANDTAAKLDYVRELSAPKSSQVMYVYSNGIETHSDAAVDVRVSKKAKSKYADAIALPEAVAGIPDAIALSRRMREVAVTNALFAFGIKAILIFLSIIGYCTLWFAVFVDMAAAIATVLNAFRVTKPSKFLAPDPDDEDEEEL